MKRMLLVAGIVCVAASVSAATRSTPQGYDAPKKPKQAGPATEAPNKAEPGTAPQRLTADRAFVMAAVQGGMTGMELGRLAATKASSPDVKRFAQRMVDAAEAMHEELKPLVKSQNVTVPAETDARFKASRDWLLKLEGEAFDRAYMSMMASKQTNDMMVFQRASTMSMDPDVKAWAAKTLLTVRAHQEMAKDINQKLVGASRGQ